MFYINRNFNLKELMSKLNITFNKAAFAEKDQTATFDRPEHKKFNMKFNNLDLMMIDAIAKANGISRSQVINRFIDQILKDFVKAFSYQEGLLITRHAETICERENKTDKDFRWDYWLVDDFHHEVHPSSILANDLHVLKEELDSGDASAEVMHLRQLLKKAR